MWAARALLVTVLVVALGGLTPTASFAQAPGASPGERVQALVQPSVVFGEVTWRGFVEDAGRGNYPINDLNGGEPFEYVSTYTGFLVNPEGWIVTAGHCVQSTPEAEDSI